MGSMVLGIVRHILTTVGGVLVTNGTLSDSDLQAAIGGLMTVIGVVWSVVEKQQAKRAAEAKAG